MQGWTVVDASWAQALQENGRFDRHLLFGSSGIQWVTWVAGTTVGAVGGALIDDPKVFGLDAVFPAFFLALLFTELKSGRARGVAAAGAAIALALVPFTPAGRAGAGGQPRRAVGAAMSVAVADRRLRRRHGGDQGRRPGRARRPPTAGVVRLDRRPPRPRAARRPRRHVGARRR